MCKFKKGEVVLRTRDSFRNAVKGIEYTVKKDVVGSAVELEEINGVYSIAGFTLVSAVQMRARRNAGYLDLPTSSPQNNKAIAVMEVGSTVVYIDSTEGEFTVRRIIGNNLWVENSSCTHMLSDFKVKGT